MKPAVLYLAAVLIAAISAAPAAAQNPVNTLSIFVDHTAPASDPLTVEQDQALSELRDNWELPADWHTRGDISFNQIARRAGIREPGVFSIKPIAEWTQGDLRRFDAALRDISRALDVFHLDLFFRRFFEGDGGGDDD